MLELIARLIPHLDVETIVPLHGGSTYETVEVNGAWIVQLGRTDYAAETLRHQVQVLPRLAPLLGVPVPKPELVCEAPTAIIYRKLDGLPCDRAPDGAWPEQLGRFLHELHATPPEFVGLAPEPADRCREQARADCARLRAVVAPDLRPAELARADALFASYLDDARNWRFPCALRHNDLGPKHVLVTPGGDLAAVIDWEEVGLGDPAWEFAWWLHAMPVTGERALAAYGEPDDARFLDRTGFVRALMSWLDVEHGVRTGNVARQQAGLARVRAHLS